MSKIRLSDEFYDIISAMNLPEEKQLQVPAMRNVLLKSRMAVIHEVK